MPDAERAFKDPARMRVAVTRPRHQCEKVLRLLRAKNAYAQCLPVLDIVPVADTGTAVQALGARNDFDLMIFVSANAVNMALRLLPEGAALSDRAMVAAVGPATGRALKAAGITVAIHPSCDVSSEGLLENPALGAAEVAGKRIMLVKGEGGRPVISRTLEARGALVTCVDVYRRACPTGKIRDLLGEPLESFGIIVITSGTALENLFFLADRGEADHVRNTQMIVASSRLAGAARQRGVLLPPIIAPAPTDEAIVDAFVSWRATRDAYA